MAYFAIQGIIVVCLTITLLPGNTAITCSDNCGGVGNTCDNITGECLDGCDNGWHGPACTDACAAGCGGQNCNRTGHCLTGCEPGWYNPFCQIQCSSNCLGGFTNCDGQGNCLHGCNEGWRGSTCAIRCHDHCQDGCYTNSTCVACEPGWYTDDCSYQCGACENSKCNRTNGLCVDGCESYYYGDVCEHQCSIANCIFCETDGFQVLCATCEEGRFGTHCIYNCSDGCEGGVAQCNSRTGACEIGCVVGRYGDKCDKDCNVISHCLKCTEGEILPSVPYLYCIECERGWWNTNCSSECASNCSSNSCDKLNGNCVDGCKPGLHAAKCNETCNANCVNETCDQTTGFCTHGCREGLYGDFCNTQCSQTCTGSVCNQDDGQCTLGCQADWTGPHCDTAKEPGLDNVLPIVVGVVVGVASLFFLLILILCLVWCYRRGARSHKLNNTDNKEYEQLQAIADASRTYEILEGAGLVLGEDDITVYNDVIGKGQFGEVRKAAVQQNGETVHVAMKSIQACATPKDLDDFRSEMEILKTVGTHPNVVSLVGFYRRTDSPVIHVLLEYCEKADLKSYLETIRPESELERLDIGLELLFLSFAIGTAKGMSFLSEKGIIHRDLATRNVLLTKDLVAKVTDFGMARVERLYTMANKDIPLPVRWLALESLRDGIFTSPSDVWSFGVLLWEIYTFGAKPYGAIQGSELENFLLRGKRLSRPKCANDHIYGIMRSCWKVSLQDRPLFPILYQQLDALHHRTMSGTYESPVKSGENGEATLQLDKILLEHNTTVPYTSDTAIEMDDIHYDYTKYIVKD